MTVRKILVFGASYGSLLAIKLALAGHSSTLVCRARTAALVNAEGVIVHATQAPNAPEQTQS